jgi:heptosyltransferase-2
MVIVFCPNWVGDVVMSTPVFSCLRQNYSQATFICVIRKYVRGVIEDSPWFDNIIDYNDKSVKGFFKIVKTIRNLNPDIVILLRNSFRSACIARLGGAKHIYGYKRDGRSLLLTDGPEPLRGKHGFKPVPMANYYMELCRFLKLKIPEDTRPVLYISDQITEKGSSLLEHYGIGSGDMVIGINPGAKFGTSKCWPPEYFAKLAELFEKQWNCKILLFVGPGEEEIASSIVENSRARIINTGPDNIDLALLKYFVKRCNLLITNDTGTRQYAVAFDIPVVVIMGPTDAEYTAANLEKTLVLQKELDCSPCHKKKCPHGHHDCMKTITPEDVFRGSITLMEKMRAL